LAEALPLLLACWPEQAHKAATDAAMIRCFMYSPKPPERGPPKPKRDCCAARCMNSSLIEVKRSSGRRGVPCRLPKPAGLC
jgi:hypothetical protein